MRFLVVDAFRLFLVQKESFCSPVTIKNYQYNLNVFFKFLSQFLDKPLQEVYTDELNVHLLDEYVVHLRNKTHLKNGVSVKMRKRTVKSYCIDLRTFLNYMFDNELIEVDLCRKFKLIKSEKAVVMPLNESEVAAIDDRFNLKTFFGIRNYCMFHLMLDCGLRRSEVVGLEFCDLDFERKLIVIRDGKGSKDRIIPFPGFLIKQLMLYKIKYRPYSTSSSVFVDKSGNAITYMSIKMVFQRLKKSSGVSRVHPHLLRHTFATSYILCGGDVAFLRMLLGHSSLEITNNYLHLAQQLSICTDNYYKLDKVYFERLKKL